MFKLKFFFYQRSPKMHLHMSKLTLSIIKFISNLYGGVFLWHHLYQEVQTEGVGPVDNKDGARFTCVADIRAWHFAVCQTPQVTVFTMHAKFILMAHGSPLISPHTQGFICSLDIPSNPSAPRPILVSISAWLNAYWDLKFS